MDFVTSPKVAPARDSKEFFHHGASFLPGRKVKQEDGTEVYVRGDATWRATNNKKLRVTTFKRDGDTDWFFVDFPKSITKGDAALLILSKESNRAAFVAAGVAEGWTESEVMQLLNEVAGKSSKSSSPMMSMDDDEAAAS